MLKGFIKIFINIFIKLINVYLNLNLLYFFLPYLKKCKNLSKNVWQFF